MTGIQCQEVVGGDGRHEGKDEAGDAMQTTFISVVETIKKLIRAMF